jgi:Luciferase-like monooxygenase
MGGELTVAVIAVAQSEADESCPPIRLSISSPECPAGHAGPQGGSCNSEFSTRTISGRFPSPINMRIEFYDRSGFRTYHMSEHHSTPLSMTPSPSVFLAAVAQRTQRIRLGPLVYVLPMHHPLRLAEEICMLDHLSRGRFESGGAHRRMNWRISASIRKRRQRAMSRPITSQSKP